MLTQAGKAFNPVADRLPHAGCPTRRKPQRRRRSTIGTNDVLSALRAASAAQLPL